MIMPLLCHSDSSVNAPCGFTCGVPAIGKRPGGSQTESAPRTDSQTGSAPIGSLRVWSDADRLSSQALFEDPYPRELRKGGNGRDPTLLKRYGATEKTLLVDSPAEEGKSCFGCGLCS